MEADAPPITPVDSLGVVADAIARTDETLELAARHLDPSLVDVLRILGFDKEYVSAQGSYLYDADGRAYLDFHTGEGFASLGHNHPDVREVLAGDARRGPRSTASRSTTRRWPGCSPRRSRSACRRGSTPCSSRAPAPRRSTRR